MTISRRVSVPRPSDPQGILKAVRVQLGEAEEKLQIACGLLRTNGFPENAAELAVELKRLRVWTQPNGWLAWLEKPEQVGQRR